MHYKRKYHPLIQLLYTSNILELHQIKQIPKTTRSYWSRIDHDEYFGLEWAEKYTNQFDQIQEVFSSSFLFKSMVFMAKARHGFLSIINEIADSKKLMTTHAKSIISSVDLIRLKTALKLNTICKFFGISRDWYYKQKNMLQCKAKPLKKCYKRFPNQLTNHEVQIIGSITGLSQNFGKPLTSIYYENIRNQTISCAKSTFFSYAAALGYRKPIYQRKLRKKGLKASRVFEWLHIDVTYVQTLNDGMQKVAFVKDNFSKAILHFGSTDKKADSIFIRDLFIETFRKYDLLNTRDVIQILSDKGSENRGFFTQWIDKIDAPPLVKKITAQTDGYPFSNSMSESTHSIYKTEFLKKKISTNQLEHLKSLERFESYYNHERFPTDLFGYTPMEVLNGKIPDKDKFKEQIAIAKTERVIINQNFNDCYLKF